MARPARKNVEKDLAYCETDSDSISIAAPKKRYTSTLERRRMVHLSCEHRRRREIQDALDALDAELPESDKRRSKHRIIAESAEYIQYLTAELDGLIREHHMLLQRANAR